MVSAPPLPRTEPAGDAVPATGSARLSRRRARREGLARFGLSRLTFTIVLANLIGVTILAIASLSLGGYREGLIDAKLEGVRAQAQIVADLLAQVAVDAEACEPVEQPVLPGAGVDPGPPVLVCDRTLDEAVVSAVFTRVWDSFEGRIRVFRAPPPGVRSVEDARALLIDDVVLREDHIRADALPPTEGAPARALGVRIADAGEETLSRLLTGAFKAGIDDRTLEEELTRALASPSGDRDRGWAWVRLNEDGEPVASVSIPIRKVQAVQGVVTSEIGGIETLVVKARAEILPFLGLAVLAAVLTSLLLTATIAQPILQLARASDRVREGLGGAGRVRIPDLADRHDEIGALADALAAMTRAIYARIEAIESFAADVAHELKNPLTSIRSAVETLDLAKTPEARDKLLGVSGKDVARMDRLITDISNASRLDAELGREARARVDLRGLVQETVDMYRATAKEGQASVRFEDDGGPATVTGNAGALARVFRNLIDNARSFSPPEGVVTVRLRGAEAARGGAVVTTVDDEGPGIPPGTEEKIFERFYTKRPAGASFGTNSGLGLAICRQIAVAHGGAVTAANRPAGEGAGGGARFTVELPAA